jgi:exodeoxyribonuclease III
MKLITWNCQGAFRKKAEAILLQQPDILVIQECEHPDKLVFNSATQRPNDLLWFGDSPHKGLGVFSYSNYKFQLFEHHNPEIKIVLPISVTGGQFDFTLFAIWANNRNDPDGQYVEQVWKAVNHYDQLLNKGRTILTGDFNSNKIWDREHRIGNHSAVVEKLAQKNIFSIYHKHLKQEQGREADPTFFLYRNKDKPYHLDYCFASADLYEKLQSFEIGIYEKWIIHSDHIPLMIHFNDKKR